ncbi:BadF/BadG/BcrA/BcrD ATPase family protein [Nonomuraea maritima]|uniref:family 4 glycosyl hydrolase n=1 Tax=Nonomuraea maritima TaxID=683260 RepID=UPI003CCBA746
MAIGFQRRFAARLGVDPARVTLDHVGLNHLSWERAVRLDSEDVLAALLRDHGEEIAAEVGLRPGLLRRLGVVPSYYLRYFYAHDAVVREQREAPSRAAEVAAMGKQLLELYADPALVTKPELLTRRGGAFYSEAAVALIASLLGDRGDTQVVNVRNDGTLPFLGQEAVIEVPATVTASGATPLPVPPVEPLYAGLIAHVSGADLPVEEEAPARAFAARGFGADVVVRNDTFAPLRAGASARWGVAVVCDAGINAVGVSPTGDVARFPPLGRLSGDWGGGHGLGEEALCRAVRAEDGRGAPTAPAGLVTAYFGTATVEELVLGLHLGQVDGGRLHELAPGALAAARDGDAVALALVERQAEEVTVLAEVCLWRLRLLETPTEVVLGGGLLTSGDPLLVALLAAGFARRAPRAAPTVADAPPVLGAALLGLDRLGAPPEAGTRLRGEYADLGGPVRRCRPA